MSRLALAFLTLSLALNAAFAVVFVRGSRSAPEPVTAPAVAPAKPAPPAITAEIWPSLKTDDLRALIVRLREAGFPPDMVRALVAAQVSESFTARRKALQPADLRTAFWKDAPTDPATEIAIFRLYREQEKVLRDLLGESPDSSRQLYLTQQGGRLDFLPVEKADEVRAVLREYQNKFNELYLTGNVTGAQNEAHRRAQHDAIAQLLTPEQLFEYDLRNSNTARQLRSDLATLGPTEEEFRAIFRLQQAHDDRYNRFGGVMPPPEQMRERDEAQKRLNAQVMAALPPERAAEYERTTDYEYRLTGQFVARLQLPPETSVALWNARKDFEKQLDAIQSAPADQRAAALASAREATNARVSTLLAGPGRLDTYKLYGGGWLQWATPPVRPTF